MSSMIRITNPDELKPIHVVMLGLFILALAGNCWLTSAAKSDVLPDGAVDWAPDSLLLAVVEVLDLNYAQPTPNGTAVKALAVGMATAVGILIVGMGFAARPRSTDQGDDTDVVIDIDTIATDRPSAVDTRRKHINPIHTAQALMLAYVVWSFLACTWAQAPDFALPGAILLAIQIAWSFVLAFGLNRRGATLASYLLVVVLAITALLAVLYHHERNPELRASYPIGNPIFLATCLIPGMLLALMTGIGGVANVARKRPVRGALKIMGCAGTLIVLALAFRSTGSRGPAIGLAVGVIAIPFFIGRRTVKIAMITVAAGFVIAAGTYFISQRDVASPTGRSASMRVRFYAWDYALNLFGERPAVGYGIGGYTLLADQFARADVEADPQALEARISHAHNEWLEVAVDLGSIGLVLLAAAVGLTLHGGARALAATRSRSASLTLCALLASLVAIVIAEIFGVGLRLEGLPLVFYSVIGLIWAMARPMPSPRALTIASRLWLRGPVAIGSVLIAFVVADHARRDFGAARAAFKVNEAIQAEDLDRATALADRAFRDRLFSQRKLVALDGLVETNLAAAQYLQDRAVQRLQAAGESAGDDTLATLGRADLTRSQGFIKAGQEALERLTTVEPGGYRVGWLEWRLQSALAGSAILENNPDLAAQRRLAGIEALSRQIERQPYDPALAAIYIAAAGPSLDFGVMLDLLARPLRMSRVPTPYVRLLNQIAQNEQYGVLAPPLIAAAEAQVDIEKTADWTDPWAPEKLRIAGIVALATSDLEQAVRYLEQGVVLYEKLGADAAVARPICYAELADARFFAHPEAPQPAIDAARTALQQMPGSQMGRAVRDTLANRLVTFHLAAGHEDDARQILRGDASRLDDADFEVLVANRYVDMAYGVFSRAFERIPDRLQEWSARALQLDPESVGSWHLAADVAAQQKNAERTVECIEKLIELKADPDNVLDAAERALRAMPDNERIQELRERAYRRARPTTQPAPNQP